ncbi:MAG: DUF1385 domain-containing protein [Deltaproteobacteria bacterium]|jgi:uncharacterized protein YqhQ|nr:DUF1385 domain-containing protein [Deltaproteobacteria bacterium]
MACSPVSGFVRLVSDAKPPLVGGQAVMEGVMMRHGSAYALAVRHPDGTIVAERRPWFSLTRSPLLSKPFVRGFPILIETLVNGIKALNRSAQQGAEGTGDEIQGWQLVLTLFLALALAIGLFVVTPHLMSIGMNWLKLGGGVEGLSFHLWDGLFKFLIFIGYIFCISFVPDIRRVFQYHGAEHKVIRAFEADGEITAGEAARHSRLHPRCGTTFLLFVLSISIILHAVLVPLLFVFWTPEGAVVKHAATILFKLLLMIPISALAYELIRYAAGLGDTWIGTVLRAPGMLLQMLTTYEPDQEQIEVAVVALAEALGEEAPERLRAPIYQPMQSDAAKS